MTEVKTLARPDGRPVRFGRKRPVARHPHLSLKNYLIGLPAPPALADYTSKAAVALAEMYDNDALGDCVIACCEHLEGVLTGNADGGQPLLYSNAQTVSFYSAACGYVPGNPNTDQGCDIQQTLAYWENHGAPAGSSHKIVGWLAVDPTNEVEIKTAIYLFENLVFGIELPDAWINPFPSASGFTWDVAGQPDQNNGHCVVGAGYTASGVTISTWGMTGTMTWAAIAEYCSAAANGELYVVISQDQLNAASQMAPNGLNWAQLVADFDAMGGHVAPPPAPAPSPSPTPTPPMPTPPAAVWMAPPNLPTRDPHVKNQIWHTGQYLMISGG